MRTFGPKSGVSDWVGQVPVGGGVVVTENFCAPVPLQSQICRRVPLAVAPLGRVQAAAGLRVARRAVGLLDPLLGAGAVAVPQLQLGAVGGAVPLMSRQRPMVVSAVPLQR